LYLAKLLSTLAKVVSSVYNNFPSSNYNLALKQNSQNSAIIIKSWIKFFYNTLKSNSEKIRRNCKIIGIFEVDNAINTFKEKYIVTII